MDPLVTPADLAKVIGLPATDPGVISAAAAADQLVLQYLVMVDGEGKPIDHAQHPKDREAALGIAVDVFQGRTASGGQVVGLEYQPMPFRMGPQLIATVSGLLAGCMDQAGELA